MEIDKTTAVGIRVEFTPEMRENATAKILQKKLNRSITDGESMPIAAGGEEIAKKGFEMLGYSVTHDNTYEYDMILDQTGETIEVKTKDRTCVNVEGLYNATVATSNCSQLANKYAFVSMHRSPRSEQYNLESYSYGFLVAVVDARLFKELSYIGFLKEIEPKSNPLFRFKNTCLNQRFMNMNSFRPDCGYFDFDEAAARERSLMDIKCSFRLIYKFDKPMREMEKAIADAYRLNAEPYLIAKLLREKEKLEQARDEYLRKNG